VLNQSGALLSSSDPAVEDNATAGAAMTTSVGTGLPAGNASRTLEGWIKTASNKCFLEYGDSSVAEGNFGLCVEGANLVALDSHQDAIDWTAPYSATDDNWHYVAITFDGTDAVAYLDGASLGSQTPSKLPLNTTIDSSVPGLVVGDISNSAVHYLDEVAVYPTVLSAARVEAHYLASGNTPPPIDGPLTAAEAPTGCGCAIDTGGDPVNTESGNFFRQFTDVSIPGRSYPLAVQRTYNSQNASVNGPFGYGWSFNYGMSVAVSGSSPNEVATVTEQDGARIPFDQPASGNVWVRASSLPDTLTHNPGSSTWTFVHDAQDTYTFNSSGQLTQEQDLNGYTTSLSYTGGNLSTVTDPEGRTLTFGWTGSNITSVTDANVSGNTRTVHYAYSGGDLTSVTDVNGGITDMAYDSSNRMVLLRVADFHGNGSLPSSGPATCSSTPTVDAVNNHYDSNGRVDCQWDPKGQQTVFAYSGTPQTAAGGSTVITDPASHEIQDSYQYGLRTSQTIGYGTSAVATTRFMYDAATLALTGMMDPNGNVTRYTVDASGNVLTKTDPLGREWKYTYNGFNEVLTAQDPNGVTTTSTYDSHGNLTSTSTPLTNTTATATNCASPSTPVAVAQVTCYTYGNSTYPGDLTQVTDPDGNVTYYHHDANGYVDEIKDPLGHVSATVRNNDGWTTATYAPKAGCTWGSSAPAGCSSTYETAYSYVVPGGSATNEFGNVGTITDPLGHTTKYTYDANQNVLTVVDGDANTTTNAYDPDNELCWTLPGGTSSDGCSSPPTNARVTDYNPDGTIADYKDGKANKIESFGYNTRGQVTSTTDALSNTTSYTLDSDGNVVNKLDPVAGANLFGHAGRVHDLHLRRRQRAQDCLLQRHPVAERHERRL
jgi:YD repeat-containing protein